MALSAFISAMFPAITRKSAGTSISAPSGLSVAQPSDNSDTDTLDLAWTDNSSTETGFEVYRSTDDISYSLVTTTAADATSYSDSGLTSNTLYYYKIRATDGVNVSAYTASASATTHSLPTDLANLQLWLDANDIGTGAAYFNAIASENLVAADHDDFSIGAGDFWLSVWCTYDSSTVVGDRVLVSKDTNTGGATEEYLLQEKAATDCMQFNVKASGIVTGTASSAVALSDNIGKWLHIYVYYDKDASTNGTVYISVNGETDVSDDCAATPQTTGTSDLIVGRWGGATNTNLWLGKCCQLMMGHTLLSAAERSEIYNSGSGKAFSSFSAGLQSKIEHHWSMTEADSPSVATTRSDTVGSQDLTDTGAVTSAQGLVGVGTPADGTPLSRFEDRSGNQEAFVQSTLANMPLYKTNIINTLPAVYFDGSNDSFLAADAVTLDLVGADTGTLLFILKQDGTQARNALVYDSSFNLEFFPTYDNVIYYRHPRTGGELTVAQPTGWDDAFHLVTLTRNGDNQAIRVDGTEIASSSSKTGNSATGNDVYLGSGAGTNPFKGYLAEWIAYSDFKTGADLTALENYLADKYGITLP